MMMPFGSNGPLLFIFIKDVFDGVLTNFGTVEHSLVSKIRIKSLVLNMRRCMFKNQTGLKNIFKFGKFIKCLIL